MLLSSCNPEHSDVMKSWIHGCHYRGGRGKQKLSVFLNFYFFSTPNKYIFIRDGKNGENAKVNGKYLLENAKVSVIV